MREREVLFIDARGLGYLESRKLRVLSEGDINRIASTYHAWRSRNERYENVPGFAKAASLGEIQRNKYVLTPPRYVGTEEAEVGDESVEDQLLRLKAELLAEFDSGRDLQAALRKRIEDFL